MGDNKNRKTIMRSTQQSVNAIRVSEVCEGQKSAITFRVS